MAISATLADAVQALALDLPLRVHFSSELTARVPTPVETAAYFAVSELLANVAKHAYASQAWIDLRHEGGVCASTSPTPAPAARTPPRAPGWPESSGGVAAFDGVLAVSSPPGGPTVVTAEIPCVPMDGPAG